MREKTVYLFDSNGYRRTRLSVKPTHNVSQLMTEVCIITHWHFTADTVKQIRVPQPDLNGYRVLKYENNVTNVMDNFELVMDFGNNIQVFVHDENYRLLFHEFVIFRQTNFLDLVRLICELHPQKLRYDCFLFMDMFCDGQFEELNAHNTNVKLNSIVSMVFLSKNDKTASLLSSITLPRCLEHFTLNSVMEQSELTAIQGKMETGWTLSEEEIRELAQQVAAVLSDYYYRRVPFKSDIEMFLHHIFNEMPTRSAVTVCARIIPLVTSLCSRLFVERRGRFARLLNHQIRVMNQPLDEGPRIMFIIIDSEGMSDSVISFNRPINYDLVKCLSVLCTKMASSFEASDIHRLGIHKNGRLIDQKLDVGVRQDDEYFVQFKNPIIRCVVYDEGYDVIFSTFFPFGGISVEEVIFLVQLKAEGKVDFSRIIRIEAVQKNMVIESVRRNQVPYGFDYLFIQINKSSSIAYPGKGVSPSIFLTVNPLTEEGKRHDFIMTYMNDTLILKRRIEYCPNVDDMSPGTSGMKQEEKVNKVSRIPKISGYTTMEKRVVVICISHDFNFLDKFSFPEEKKVRKLKQELCSMLGVCESNVIEVRMAEELDTKVNLILLSNDCMVELGHTVVVQLYSGESEAHATSDDMLVELPPHLRDRKFEYILRRRISDEVDVNEIIKGLERGCILEKRLKQLIVRTVVAEMSQIVFGRRPRTKEYILLLDQVCKEYPNFDKQQLFQYDGAGWGHPFLHTGNSNFQSRQKSYCRSVQLIIGTTKVVIMPNVRRSRAYTPRKRKARIEVQDTTSLCYYEAAQALLYIVEQVVNTEALQMSTFTAALSILDTKSDTAHPASSCSVSKFNYSNSICG